MNKTRISVAILALLVAACGGGGVEATTTIPSSTAPATTQAPPVTATRPVPTTTQVEFCSTAGLRMVILDQELPDAVDETRQAIFSAAAACDHETLAGLTSPGFTFSFGGGEDPAGYWHDLEQRVVSSGDGGPPPLLMMLQLLNLEYGTVEVEDTTYYVWPAAFAYHSWEEVPQAERDALLDIYGAADLQVFAEFGGYVGYRLGITADGEWLYFVAGD